MEKLFILETPKTPRVEMNLDGTLSIEGRSLPLDSYLFFDPIIKWVKEITSNDINFSIRLDYINTCSVKNLLIIFQLLKTNPVVTSMTINWYYEEDDEDSRDLGQEFESIIGIPFKFHVLSEELTYCM